MQVRAAALGSQGDNKTLTAAARMFPNASRSKLAAKYDAWLAANAPSNAPAHVVPAPSTGKLELSVPSQLTKAAKSNNIHICTGDAAMGTE